MTMHTTRRCYCGQTFALVSLRDRQTQCVACQRKVAAKLQRMDETVGVYVARAWLDEHNTCSWSVECDGEVGLRGRVDTMDVAMNAARRHAARLTSEFTQREQAKLEDAHLRCDWRRWPRVSGNGAETAYPGERGAMRLCVYRDGVDVRWSAKADWHTRDGVREAGVERTFARAKLKAERAAVALALTSYASRFNGHVRTKPRRSMVKLVSAYHAPPEPRFDRGMWHDVEADPNCPRGVAHFMAGKWHAHPDSIAPSAERSTDAADAFMFAWKEIVRSKERRIRELHARIEECQNMASQAWPAEESEWLYDKATDSYQIKVKWEVQTTAPNYMCRMKLPA